MRRLMIALVAAALALALLPVATASAGHGGGTYLALGDSVGAGTQQPLPFTANGYTNKLYAELQRQYGFDDFVNLACPGDDTAEMLNGIGGASPLGSLCYGPNAVLPPGGRSQMAAALAYLRANPGKVGLITIVIGANDILACDPTAPPEEVEACLGAQLGQIATYLPVILTRLRTAAPGVPIVAMNYYNPNLAFWITGAEGQALALQSLGLTTLFNGTLEAIYGAFGVPVADVETAFNTFAVGGGQDPPLAVRSVCNLTLMCHRTQGGFVLSDYDPGTPGPQTDIHPSNRGYNRISRTHIDLINGLGLLGP